MIKRLILHNFMAHAHTEIDLSPGLTAITGLNNVGKSAVVEALRCVALNPAMGKAFIRHGAKSARVEVVLDDDVRIIWIRKPPHAGYEVHVPGEPEPREYWKLGQSGVPEDVQDRLRLAPVILDEGKKNQEKIDVHLGDQRAPVFLLNLSGQRQAAFFASSSESAHLLAMQKLLKDKVRRQNTVVADAEARLQQAETRLDDLAPLPGLQLAMEAAHARLEAVEKLERRLPLLERLLTDVSARKREAELQRGRLNVLRRTAQPPEPADTRRLDELLTERARTARFINQTHRRLKSLEPLKTPADLAETAGLASIIQGMVSTSSRLNREQSRQQALQGLLAPKEPQPTAELERLIQSISRLAAERHAAEARADRLQALQAPPEPQDPAPLERMVGELQRLHDQEQKLTRQVQQRRQALKEHAEMLRQRLDALGRCPLCGQPLDSADVFSHLTGEDHEPAA